MSKANEFDKAWRRLKLKYGNLSYPIRADNPYMIRSQDDKRFKVIELLHRMVEESTHLYLRGELKKVLKFSPLLQKLIRIDPAYPDTCPIGRWDSFYGDGELKLLELNTDGTSGMAYVDALNSLYEKFHHLKIHSDTLKESVLQSLISCFRKFKYRRKEIPQIAIVDWTNVPTKTDQKRTAEYFIERGYRTILADPRELTYDGRCLWSGNFRIDLIYRRLVTTEYLVQYKALQILTRSYEEHGVCMVGSFRSQIGFDKRLFVIFSSPEYKHLFKKTEWESAQEVIPWTRLLCPQKTLYRNEAIQIPEDLIDRKNHFLIKPPNLNRGEGVYFGEQCTKSQWARLIQKKINSGYIVQEKLEVPIWREIQCGVQLGHYIFSGKLSGWMARVSNDKILGDRAEEYLVPCLKE